MKLVQKMMLGLILGISIVTLANNQAEETKAENTKSTSQEITQSFQELLVSTLTRQQDQSIHFKIWKQLENFLDQENYQPVLIPTPDRKSKTQYQIFLQTLSTSTNPTSIQTQPVLRYIPVVSLKNVPQTGTLILSQTFYNQDTKIPLYLRMQIRFANFPENELKLLIESIHLKAEETILTEVGPGPMKARSVPVPGNSSSSGGTH